MTIRFHPPEDQETYAEKVLAVLLAAALPVAADRLERLIRDETAGKEKDSA